MRMLPHGRRVLWKLVRAGQFVRCEVTSHPFGAEVRYLVNGKPILTRVFEDTDALEMASDTWRNGLQTRGWRQVAEPAEPVLVAS